MSRGLKSVAIFIAFAAIYTLSRHVTSSTTPRSTTTSGVVAASTTTTTTTTSNTVTGTTCRGVDFQGVFNQGQGAAGTIYASVTLTKATAGQCTINGWPLLTLQDKNGTVLALTQVNQPGAASQVQFPANQANKASTTLVMQKGSVTNFSVAYSDVPTGATACADVVTISVQFRSGGTPTTVTPEYSIAPCDNGRMWVSPFY